MKTVSNLVVDASQELDLLHQGLVAILEVHAIRRFVVQVLKMFSVCKFRTNLHIRCG